jgi:hypothetical protein
MNEFETKKNKIEKVVKVAAALIVGFVVAPFIFIAIQGLVGLVVAAGVALIAINLAPWFATTVANWKLKALKAAAAANPIETLENRYKERQEALVKIRENIKQSYAVLEGLYSQIQEHSERYPDRPSQYLTKYQKLKALVALRAEKYKTAQRNLVSYAELIEEKRSDWKIALTMAEASKLANVGEDFQSKLLQDTALTTIQDGLNVSFAELETSLLDEEVNEPQRVEVASNVVQPETSTKVLLEKCGPLDLDIDFRFDGDKVSTQRR